MEITVTLNDESKLREWFVSMFGGSEPLAEALPALGFKTEDEAFADFIRFEVEKVLDAAFPALYNVQATKEK